MSATNSQSSIDTNLEAGSQSQNGIETAQYFINKTASLNIVKTTIQPDGQIIDWIPIESQGEVASPPPLPASPFHPSPDAKVDYNSESDSWQTNRPLTLLEMEGAEKGPGGTVPILRQDLKLLSNKQTLTQRLSKPAPPPPGEKESYSPWPHWYSSTGQTINNIGTCGDFSCYKAAVQNKQDFSLLQTAVIKTSVPTPGNPTKPCDQTIEVGWINYPAQVAQPHLFTFFNTNGYTQIADYKGGWNTEVKGWVQYDHTIFPGAVVGPLCVDGGLQTIIPIKILLHEGNWWVFVIDRWIGYYPASLFSKDVADPGQTLARGSDQINWYGEVYQTDETLTTTDMGSGEWPWTHFTHSAFMKNITYIDADNVLHDYDGTQHSFVSDDARYTMETHSKSGIDRWQSYMWIGGPGAGGKVGAEHEDEEVRKLERL